MNLRLFCCFDLLFIVPFICFGQNKPEGKSQSEITLLLKNRMYAHTTDFSDFNNYITCKNTFGQAVGIDYTYVIDKSLLVSAGAEIGYERYKFIANKPFAQSDIADGMQPDISTAIYSTALNVNIDTGL